MSTLIHTHSHSLAYSYTLTHSVLILTLAHVYTHRNTYTISHICLNTKARYHSWFLFSLGPPYPIYQQFLLAQPLEATNFSPSPLPPPQQRSHFFHLDICNNPHWVPLLLFLSHSNTSPTRRNQGDFFTIQIRGNPNLYQGLKNPTIVLCLPFASLSNII